MVVPRMLHVRYQSVIDYIKTLTREASFPHQS